jgi:GNAT superfamily N-acetyltransferase
MASSRTLRTSLSLLAWFPDSESKFMTGERANGPAVRDAVPSDAGAVAAIGRVAVPETYRAIIADESVMEAIVAQSYALDALGECILACATADDCHFLVAEHCGQIAGFLHYDCDGPEPELHRIYVEPAQKRQGIGSALLEELHRRLSVGSSYVLMVVAANTPAVSFYKRHGLVEVASVDGVTYMRERMGVRFKPGTGPVPALILRYSRPAS